MSHKNSAPSGTCENIKKTHGINGMPMVNIFHSNGAGVSIYLHGGHITSWTDADGREMLFMSKHSCFRSGMPIRGGIPVIFPQFSDNGPLPKHGLVRTREWKLLKTGNNPDGEPLCILGMESDDETRAKWPFDFKMELEIRLGAALSLLPSVTNTGKETFDFSMAFHTYFATKIKHTEISGLNGVTYSDALLNGEKHIEQEPAIRFSRETDRVYLDAPDHIILSDDTMRLEIEKQNMRDAVVWNPWIEKSKRMEDFGDEEYAEMVCVETGNIRNKTTLPPGEQWKGLTRLSRRKDGNRHVNH